MKAIVVTDQDAGRAGMTLVDRPQPSAAVNDVVVEIHAPGFVPTEMEWPSTCGIAPDTIEHPRSPATCWPERCPPWAMARRGCRSASVCSVSPTGIATAHWRSTSRSRPAPRAVARRRGLRAQHVPPELRADRLAGTLPARPPPGGAERPGPRCRRRRRDDGDPAGPGGRGIRLGTGRAADREKALDFGAQEFLDLQSDALEDVGAVDLVFDVIGSHVQTTSADLIKRGGTLISVVGPVVAHPTGGPAVDLVVEADRSQLGEIVQRVRDGRLRTNIGTVAPVDDAVTALNSTERRRGKPIIRVRP